VPRRGRELHAPHACVGSVGLAPHQPAGLHLREQHADAALGDEAARCQRLFAPRDAAAEPAMKATSPVLASRTTLWNAWVGFNASHSLGALLFAAVYLTLSLWHMARPREAPTLVWLAALGGLAYLALAIRYWFGAPRVGIALATACFVAAAIALSV
jgi:hypothetical protein